jgi:hypothetical protein
MILLLTYNIYQFINSCVTDTALSSCIILNHSLNLSPYHSWGIEGISLVFLLACWAVAAVHAYLAGQKMDRMAA